jgi:hypothetical protein
LSSFSLDVKKPTFKKKREKREKKKKICGMISNGGGSRYKRGKGSAEAKVEKWCIFE